MRAGYTGKDSVGHACVIVLSADKSIVLETATHVIFSHG